MEMRPVRRSSEGPEVVNAQVETPDKYSVPPFAFDTPIMFKQHKPDERPLETEVYPSPSPEYPPPRTYDPLSPHAGHDPLDLPPVSHVDRQHHKIRSALPLVTAILLVCIAFLLGGAIGGGIGGSLVAKEKSKVARLENTIATAPTVTVTAPGSVQTITYDAAGCPYVHNKTFATTTAGYTFLKLCNNEIIPVGGTGSIDASSSAQSSFDDCLNACATYNKEVKKGGCQGATWVTFSPKHPENNNVCFLKNSTGVLSPGTDGQQHASGMLNGFPA